MRQYLLSMAHNTTARAAQGLASRRCRINAAPTGASTMNTTRTTLGIYSEAARPRLDFGYSSKYLWNPAMVVKFAPEPEVPPLYPALDFRRFFQSQEAVTVTRGDSTPSEARLLQPPELATIALAKQQCSENQPIPPVAVAAQLIGQDASDGHPVRPQSRTQQPGRSRKEPQPSIEPPLTSLDFTISRELFQAARNQPKDSPSSFWSHTMYRRADPDGTTHNVKVHYCTSKHTMEHVCRRYFLDEPVLGFDLEWVAFADRTRGPRANVSLIQLASPSRIGLFHLALFPGDDDFVAPTFGALMEDPAVYKVGVHIQADCTRLRTFLGVRARGVFELSHLYKLVKYALVGGEVPRRKLINKVPVALATQVQDVLGLPLFKGQDVRSSDWANPLTSKQLTYSAADAYAGLQLYHVLEERRLAMDPPPDRPHLAELGLPIPIPPTPVVSDAESDPESDTESVENSSSEFSDGSIEEAMLELAAAETFRAAVPSSEPEVQAQPEARDGRIEAAEALVAQRRASRPGGRLLATSSSLRAFYVWQTNDALTPADVGRLLRDPPLQTGTVVGYILDAILAEKLAYSRERLRVEVLSLLHPTLASGKYKAILKQCEQSQT